MNNEYISDINVIILEGESLGVLAHENQESIAY